MPSDPQNEPSGYVVRFAEVEFPLGARRSEPLDYVTAVMGAVSHGRSEAVSETVCEFSFQHLHVDWARQDRFSLKTLFASDPAIDEMFPLLFDPATEHFTFGKADGPDTTNDILHVDEMSIRPDHRGRGLGGAILDELVNQYRRQWAVLVLRAAPEPAPRGAWSDEVYSGSFATSGEAAKRKLRVYWARFGFHPLGTGNLMARDVRSREDGRSSLRGI